MGRRFNRKIEYFALATELNGILLIVERIKQIVELHSRKGKNSVYPTFFKRLNNSMHTGHFRHTLTLFYFIFCGRASRTRRSARDWVSPHDIQRVGQTE